MTILTSRFRLFVFSFVSSIVVSIVIAALILSWYSWGMAVALEALPLLGISLVVFIGLITILSVIFFKKEQKKLISDLIIIWVLLLGAIIWVAIQFYQVRPEWLVFNVDRFDVVTHSEAKNMEWDEIDEDEFKEYCCDLKLAYAEIPTNVDEKFNVMYAEAFEGASIVYMSKYYRPLDKGKLLATKNSKMLKDLYKYNDKAKVDKIIVNYNEDYRYLPLHSKTDVTVIIKINPDFEVIKVVNLKPWDLEQ